MPFDPADSAFLDDPYPTFAALRAIAPVHEHPLLGMPVAVSHAACSEVLRGRALGRIWADAAAGRELPGVQPAAPQLVAGARGASRTTGCGRWSPAPSTAGTPPGWSLRCAPWPPACRRARRLRPAHRLRRPHVRRRARAPGGGHRRAAGLPGSCGRGCAAGRPRSSRCTSRSRRRPAGAPAEAASAEFVAALRELTAYRRAHPGDDLVSDLVAADLDADELVGTAALLLMAGHEATVNVIGNGVLALLVHPAQWRRLVDDPALDATAVEELIRFDPPLQLFERTAVRDTSVAGHPVPGGDQGGRTARRRGARPPGLRPPDRARPRAASATRTWASAWRALLPGRAAGPAGDRRRAGRAAPPDAGTGAAAEPVRRPDFVMRGLQELRVTS